MNEKSRNFLKLVGIGLYLLTNYFVFFAIALSIEDQWYRFLSYAAICSMNVLLIAIITDEEDKTSKDKEDDKHGKSN